MPNVVNLVLLSVISMWSIKVKALIFAIAIECLKISGDCLFNAKLERKLE